MPVKQRMKPSVTILDVERGQWGHCVTADIPIYRGGARTHTIETERPTRMVCGLITQSSRATNIEAVSATSKRPLTSGRFCFWRDLFHPGKPMSYCFFGH